MKIYHNPKCSKSRQCLKLIKQNTSNFKIILYLNNRLSVKEIKTLLSQLNIKIIELVRKEEKIWKEYYKQKKLTENEIIEILSKYPKLIERPIIEHENVAIIGRPPENVLRFFT